MLNRGDSVWHDGVHYSLFLNLISPNLGLTQPILVLYMREKLPTKGTSALHHLSLVHLIFLPRNMPSLFFSLPNTNLFIENVKTFKFQSTVRLMASGQPLLRMILGLFLPLTISFLQLKFYTIFSIPKLV